jgi:hypothetical protein
MKRKDALIYIKVAGYHGDNAALTRLYIENRISLKSAYEAYEKGIRAKQAGISCSCISCRKEYQKEND